MASRIRKASRDEDQGLLRRTWTIPILTSLHRPSHFNYIRKVLMPITDRALSQSLKAMETQEWVARSVDDTARPPRSIYSAINLGQTISGIVGSEVRL